MGISVPTLLLVYDYQSTTSIRMLLIDIGTALLVIVSLAGISLSVMRCVDDKTGRVAHCCCNFNQSYSPINPISLLFAYINHEDS